MNKAKTDSVQDILRADSIKHKRAECCERCGDELDNTKAVWLELSTHTGLYTDPDKVQIPEAESQGCFAFGSACARAVLKAGGECEHIKGRA